MTTVFTTPKEALAMCKDCGKTKGVSAMVPSKSSKLGYLNTCRECKNAAQKARKAKRAQAVVARVTVERKLRDSDPTIAKPRAAIVSGPWAQTGREYYRNDGHKNMPSKGVGT